MSLERYPRHMDGIVPTFHDATLFTSTGVWAQQRSNALGNLQAPDAAYLDNQSFLAELLSVRLCGFRDPIGE